MIHTRDIPYYADYISDALLDKLLGHAHPVPHVANLVHIGHTGGLESPQALTFLCSLYESIAMDLRRTLRQRTQDREFLDKRVRACAEFNRSLNLDPENPFYQSVIGFEDGTGRVVIGPKNPSYCRPGGGKPIAPLPPHLQGHHVTLFGPPDDAKLSINAMNALHRKLKGEPAIVDELVSRSKSVPKWGADDEDSKTPLRADLIQAGDNLSRCFDKSISFTDPTTSNSYSLATNSLSQPIKRFPGLALPTTFLFFKGNPIPLHLYDFALHLFRHWNQPEALTFYVPKLENEEEASYISTMIRNAERLLQKSHPSYKEGTVRIIIVLENPRAVFRVNEIMDALYPYFAGASLGWHDYLASTARLFKEDSAYRIPVKADPHIVIKYIKASHHLLADVVGPRGGIKIGGMYGILPMQTDFASPSFQVTLKGFFMDVIAQLKRNLDGFWVAHPDFVRIGVAIVEAFAIYKTGDSSKLESLMSSLLLTSHQKSVMDFLRAPDIKGLDVSDPKFPRSLIVADLKESTFIANNDVEEIRYNVFQSLQYLTDWLSGNGCVALPAQLEGIPVRVMDDLATAERSRWEVWHELHHKRFPLEDFVRIVHEEMRFIRKDLSDNQKIVQVKWNQRTAKWYPLAQKIMLHLMTAHKPVEFATELLMPLTVDFIRDSSDPWHTLRTLDPQKYELPQDVYRLDLYFGHCGARRFAREMAQDFACDFRKAQSIILSLTRDEIIEAASFHGDIGESPKTLDHVAASEQSRVSQSDETLRLKLQSLGTAYFKKFGIKFLVSAQGQSAAQLLKILESRLNNSAVQEEQLAREALWDITRKRLEAMPPDTLMEQCEKTLRKHAVKGAMVTVSSHHLRPQTFCMGEAVVGKTQVKPDTHFELASLSKTLASCFAIEFFRKRNISLDTRVNELFERTKSDFRLQSESPRQAPWAREVTINHLLSHCALNMHYVHGVPLGRELPQSRQLLDGNPELNYPPVRVIHEPGSVFQYSGGGYLVLEHLIESLENKSIHELTDSFFSQCGIQDLTFRQNTLAQKTYANGYTAEGIEIPSGRKMYPACAAGAMGTTKGLHTFLSQLTQAYQSLDGDGPISHDTAVAMLHATDKGSSKFMGAGMGLGVFIVEAGPNRFAVHQGANSGFRCLFIHCFKGPDKGTGVSMLCNGETNGMLFIAETTQILLRALRPQGVDLERFGDTFSTQNLKIEEIVNQGYKRLIFSAFEPDLPEAIVERAPLDMYAKHNLAIGAKIIECSNQRFARAENLISPHEPVFDPTLFGRQGKIMDSWETSRHNPYPCDDLILELPKASPVRTVSLSTRFHLGNHAPVVSVEGCKDESFDWSEVIPKTELKGHALTIVPSTNTNMNFRFIRVSMYPDGGLTRIGLFADGPENENHLKLGTSPYMDPIPKTAKSLAPRLPTSFKAPLPSSSKSKVNLASAAFGAKIVSATNEHYGPASQVISPFPPIDMFDGLESARSRVADHSESVILQLASSGSVSFLECDFTYFVHNNPREIQIEGRAGESGPWISLFSKQNVKAYAGNSIRFSLASPKTLSQIKVTTFPDGGINRIRVYG